MAKEEKVILEGSVIDILPDGQYMVEIEGGHQILGYTSGKNAKIQHPHRCGRQSDDRNVTLRPQSRPNHLPRCRRPPARRPARPTKQPSTWRTPPPPLADPEKPHPAVPFHDWEGTFCCLSMFFLQYSMST